ncbi:hypothetical protein Sjap_026661 [Stephania japonica]|uniref:Uncharacterized protein n=1 Tax=Stephania japonica TaxID=461633 RepID=A0AAP0DUU5_9MAGN
MSALRERTSNGFSASRCLFFLVPCSQLLAACSLKTTARLASLLLLRSLLRWYSASSRRIQFHRVHVGDSGAVVTPFVQVATYATRNFATLGQLELLPPFTGASIQSLEHFSFRPYSTGQVFRGKPAISDLGWPFTPSHKSSPYFATYVGSVLQGLLELSSTCSWLDRSVSGQIGRTLRFHLWKAPTPNGLSRCSHFLADPSCKRYAVRVSAPAGSKLRSFD